LVKFPPDKILNLRNRPADNSGMDEIKEIRVKAFEIATRILGPTPGLGSLKDDDQMDKYFQKYRNIARLVEQDIYSTSDSQK
jgi:hypothetical protein